MENSKKPALEFKILAKCNVTKARTSIMSLPHYDVETPVFMPVGTQGTLKGLLPEQLKKLDVQLLLGNTYHLGTRPGIEIIKKAGGLHNFMGWDRAILTDSGGFQMVSLLKLAEITEEGVKFQSPYENGKDCMLTPEHSIEIQNAIGADIIMQLDDVVPTLMTGPRVEEGCLRTNRWLERCILAHQKKDIQNLFPIVQGNLSKEMRKISVEHHSKCDVNGFAIGGLSGGEKKDDFWPVVDLCTSLLPETKPRYVMGIGFSVDLVVCVALGADMFDCVFPTRTARFGCALTRKGQLNLRKIKYAKDFQPIETNCTCTTCDKYTRAYIHGIVAIETVTCNLITVHNLAHHMKLMKDIRESIKLGKFPEFVQQFMLDVYEDKNYPKWIVDALKAVNIDLIS